MINNQTGFNKQQCVSEKDPHPPTLRGELPSIEGSKECEKGGICEEVDQTQLLSSEFIENDLSPPEVSEHTLGSEIDELLFSQIDSEILCSRHLLSIKDARQVTKTPGIEDKSRAIDSGTPNNFIICEHQKGRLSMQEKKEGRMGSFSLRVLEQEVGRVRCEV